MRPERLERAIHDAVNAFRERHGLLDLAYDPDLAEVARYHSKRMRSFGEIYHVAPDGESLSDRLEVFEYGGRAKAAGPAFCSSCGADLRRYSEPEYCARCGRQTKSVPQSIALSGENVAYFRYSMSPNRLQSTELASKTVDAWSQSPEHRENLLCESYGRGAVGVAVDRADGTRLYITHNFS